MSKKLEPKDIILHISNFAHRLLEKSNTPQGAYTEKKNYVMLLFTIYKQNVNIRRLSRIRFRIKEKPTSGFISQRHSKLVYAYR